MMLSNLDPRLAQAWHPVALATEVSPTPRRVWLLGDPWVLVQAPTDDVPRAYKDACPHRRAPLSAGSLLADGTLQCGYHGWRFDECGTCVAIPALGPAATITGRADLQRAAGV